MWPFPKKKPIKEVEFPKEEERKPGAEIIFSVVDGKVNVEMWWYCAPEKTEEIKLAMEFGQLLSNVSTGYYVEEVLQIFNEYLKQAPEEKPFIDDVMLTWKECNLIKQEELEEQLQIQLDKQMEEPAVDPLKVFRQSSMFKE